MPASSISSSISWAVYFAASLVLVSVCSPVLVGARNYACADTAAGILRGTAEIVDGLEPGMVVSFSFSSPGPGDVISMGGRTLTALWCGTTTTSQTGWELPSFVLTPGASYHLGLAGDEVEVAGFVGD